MEKPRYIIEDRFLIQKLPQQWWQRALTSPKLPLSQQSHSTVTDYLTQFWCVSHMVRACSKFLYLSSLPREADGAWEYAFWCRQWVDGFFFFLRFIYWLLCWVFVSVLGLSLVVASGGHSSSRCAGLSLSQPLLLRSTGSRRAGSVVVAHGPSRSAACGIFPDQGANPCSLH